MAGYLESKIEKLNNGQEVLVLGRSVNFLLITADDYFLLAKQSRAGAFGERVLNLYGGMLDEDETPMYGAIRELKEEANIGEEDIVEKYVVYEDLNPSLGVIYESNTLYMFVLKHTKKELKQILKCNDKNENIKPKFLKVTADISNIKGMKANMAIRHYRTLKKIKAGD